MDQNNCNLINKRLVNSALLESSILFGRLLLEFVGIKQFDGSFVRFNRVEKKGGDILINHIFQDMNLCNLDHPSLLNNKDEIFYLLKVSSKRVAHNTSYFNEKTEVEKIHKAQRAIHELIEEMLPNISTIDLLKYNDMANMTT